MVGVANAVDGVCLKVMPGGAGLVTGTVDVDTVGTISNPVDIGSVATTVEVNVASTTDPIEVTPGESSSSDQDSVSVDATGGGTEILAAGARKAFMLFNTHSSITVYLGFGNTPTTGSGYPLLPLATFVSPANAVLSMQVLGITSSGTADVRKVVFP
jgi:hypothetical protein